MEVVPTEPTGHTTPCAIGTAVPRPEAGWPSPSRGDADSPAFSGDSTSHPVGPPYGKLARGYRHEAEKFETAGLTPNKVLGSELAKIPRAAYRP
jgi:hypothetical protein